MLRASVRTRRSRRRRLGLVVSGCLLAGLVAGIAGAADPTFTPAPGSPIDTYAGPWTVLAADLDRDGNPDLAYTADYRVGSSQPYAGVLLGDGSGGFSPGPGTPAPIDGFAPGLVSGDWNRDGKPDLASASIRSDTVTVLLGDGLGGFGAAPGSPIGVGSFPNSLVAADLSRDGRLDLVASNGGDGNITILLGDGTGRFKEAEGSPVHVAGWAASSVAVDLNHDGRLDLAISGSDYVTVLLGDGLGGFSEAAGSPIHVGHVSRELAAADLNLDGLPDLAVLRPAPMAHYGDLRILLGDGTGRFDKTAIPPIPAGDSPNAIAVADLNLDGAPDLAVADGELSNVIIMLGDGTGDFSPSAGSPFAAGGQPYGLVASDLNHDGRADLALANYDSENISILLNTAAPTAVKLADFSARPLSRGVELRWRAQGAGVLGFNVYRSGARLNRTLIPARGTAYRLLDRGARAGTSHVYRLQAVRLDGTRAWLGTATAKR
ncbi:MAG: FG-GAP repeat domain-containing protein [Gaiellaceae bacterium]